jgi:cytochrome c
MKRPPEAVSTALVLAVLIGGTALVLAGRSPAGLRSGAVKMNDMLAVADARAGEQYSKACAACHSFERGGPNKVGPNLFGIVGAPMASRAGFRYSEALLALKGEIWTTDALYDWLHDPSGFAPGTTMAIGGMLDPQDRMDLIAYLMTLH